MEKLPQPKSPENKQTVWDNTLKSLDNIVDGLGMPIDPRIKETVAALMVNGFPTTMSCEGHVEIRNNKLFFKNPFVHVGHRKPKEMYVGEDDLMKRIAQDFSIPVADIDKSQEAKWAFSHYIINQKVPETKEFIEAKYRNKLLNDKLKSILDEYYRSNNSPDSKKITIETFGPVKQLIILSGNDFKSGEILESEKENYEKVLTNKRSDMQAFGQFLKDKFFASA